MRLNRRTIIIIVVIGIGLSAGVILGLNGYFGGGATIPEDTMTRGLVGYWSFDEGSGTIAYDASSAGNNGTLTNGPQWTKGKISGALSFDGKDDYVEATVSQTKTSYELWYNSGSIWQHLVKVDSNYYVNGVSGTPSVFPIYVSGDTVQIGKNESGNCVSGTIDEVRIYNRALSAEEIRYHYNRGGPVAHWKFDEGSGTTAHDETENNNNGTLTNGPTWTTGRYNSAIEFDGVDDYVSVNDNSTLDISSAITLGAWVKDPIGAWLSGYTYRKKITLQGQTGAGTNYQVKLLIGESSGADGEQFDLGGKIQTDFDDIRFTDNDETTELDYWIESISGTTPNQLATVWVEVKDSLESNVDIYIYYGNASATSGSNGDNTFLFFDDFPGSSLDTTNKWDIDNHANIVYTVADSYLKVSGSGPAPGGDDEWYKAKYTVSSENIITAKLKLVTIGTKSASVIGFRDDTTSGIYAEHSGFGLIGSNWDGYNAIGLYTTDWAYINGIVKDNTDVVTGTFYTYTVKLSNYTNGTTIKSVNGGSEYTDSNAEIANQNTRPFLRAEFENDTSETWFDYILVRKYASTEPAYSSAGGEEWNATVAGYTYYKKITITGQAGAGTNYQVKLLVGESSGADGEQFDLNSHIQTDFDDIRFTDDDETTELDYWVESISGITPNQLATVWVEVADSLESNVDIYVYYGNASASSASNGTNTFLFFDDFSDGNYNGWSVAQGTWTAASNYLMCTSAGVPDEIRYSVSTFNTFRLRAQIKFTADTNDALILAAEKDTRAHSYQVYLETTTPSIQLYRDGSVGLHSMGAGSGPTTTGTWERVELTRDSSNNIAYYYKDILQASVVNNVNTEFNAIAVESHIRANTHLFDNIFLSKFVSPEPAYSSAGGEEMFDNKKIIYKGNDAYSLQMNSAGSVLYGYISNNVISAIVSNVSDWHYVAMTFDGTNQKLYLDGNLVNSATPGGTIGTNSTNLKIGELFSGKIDEVRIYNYARTVDEIRLDFQTGYATHFGPTAKTCAEDPASCMDYSLVGYWNMDEAAGTTAYDASESGNNGILTNGPKWVKGKISSGLSFDGKDDYVNIGNIGTDIKSIEFWFKPNSTTESILEEVDDTGITISSGTMTYPSWDNCFVDGIDTNTITSGWHHIVITSTSNVTMSAFRLALVNTTYFKGLIDEVKVYNRELSAEEIRYHYNRGAPVAHWKFDEGSGSTAYDETENNNNGTLTNSPTWTTGKYNAGISFDGTDDYVSAADAESLDLGTGNFTLEAWIKSAEDIDNETDQLGDILTKFDQANKKGFNLGLLRQSSFGSQSNYRNLFFGIDNNKPDIIWVEKAPKLGAETYILSLAVYNGKLYGGTLLNGKLYEWNGTNAWVEKAPKLGDEIHIRSLAVYNGKLYGGTYPNGKLYEWNGTNAWVEKAPKLGAETYISSLAVYNGKLYGGTAENGKLYEWNGTNAWVEKAPKLGDETYILSLAVYNGKLYGGTAENGKLYEWNGTNAWVEKAPKLGTETNILSLAVYNGKLYGGTAPNGKLYEWNGTNAWVEKAPKLGAETFIYSLAVYNGKLYGGTLLNGKLYEWNGTNAWVEKAPKLGDETYILSLAVYNGKLYGGTYPNGKLYEWKTGVAATYDYQVGNGWQHITAVRDTNTLKLYLNSNLVKTSNTFIAADYDISNANALLIGSGMQDYMKGTIDDVRVYNYARTADEIRLDYQSGMATHLGPSGKTCSEDPAGCMDYGLVGYWGFDEGSGTKAYDSSDSGNHGTLTNGPKWTKGKISGGLSFDGTNDYVNCGSGASLNITSAITIEAWVFLPNIVGGKTIIDKIVSAGGFPGYLVYISNGNLQVYFDGGGADYNQNILEANKWLHIVVSGDGTVIRVYKNGIMDATTGSYAGITTNSENLQIGVYGGSGYFNGLIDEVRIYNRALSEEEVRYHYNKGAPVGYWKFDEGSGTKAYDESPNNYNGTLTNMEAADWVESNPLQGGGSSLDFDGTDEFVDVGTSYNGVKTVSFWMKADNTTKDIIDLNGSAYIHVSSGTITTAGFTSPTIYVDGKQSSTTIDTNWHHVAVTTDTALNASDLDIGRREGSTYFDGKLDDVKIYNYARTADQIRMDYQQGVATHIK